MTDDRQSGLQALFDAARNELDDDAFVTQVMTQVDSLRHRTMLGWIVGGLVLILVGWWLSRPLIGAVNLATQMLPKSLVVVEEQWMAELLAPVNSIAGVAGLLFLGAWVAYRKIFS